MTFPNNRDCPHGSQWGKCPECELEEVEQRLHVLQDMLKRERLFAGWPGCSNHSCIVTGPKKGMGTNGACGCLPNATRSQLGMLQGKLNMLVHKAEEDL